MGNYIKKKLEPQIIGSIIIREARVHLGLNLIKIIKITVIATNGQTPYFMQNYFLII